ncbi:MAG: beta-lactamase family protein [Acidobacteria bacterium]|nr:beta-lactamase family protein [Acidobacteriota bacterium]
MKINCRLALLFVLLLALSVSFNVAAQDAPLQGFDDYVSKAMKDWEVPGVAIAVVKDDKVVFAKGYGVRELGKSTPVNERTIFAIGSSSKAFTAAALAVLVDEGKIKWDDPVTKHLPSFELYDAYAAKEMTVRDLLCHRSGLARGDMMWYGSDFNREEILRRTRHLKPSWSFRSQFGYQNLMYLAAGQIVQAVTGKSWDDFVRERLFKPLGMAASSTSTKDLRSSDNVATPHGKIDEKVMPITWRNIDNIAPAGSINSNVVEVAAWVRLQLNQGSFAGQRMLSSGARVCAIQAG